MTRRRVISLVEVPLSFGLTHASDLVWSPGEVCLQSLVGLAVPLCP